MCALDVGGERVDLGVAPFAAPGFHKAPHGDNEPFCDEGGKISSAAAVALEGSLADELLSDSLADLTDGERAALPDQAQDLRLTPAKIRRPTEGGNAFLNDLAMEHGERGDAGGFKLSARSARDALASALGCIPVCRQARDPTAFAHTLPADSGMWMLCVPLDNDLCVTELQRIPFGDEGTEWGQMWFDLTGQPDFAADLIYGRETSIVQAGNDLAWRVASGFPGADQVEFWRSPRSFRASPSACR